MKSEIPPRYSLGVTLDYCKLGDLLKFASFSQADAIQHMQNYSMCSGKVLCVKSSLSIPNLQNNLTSLDVVLEAGGERVGCNLYKFQQIVNTASYGIELVIFRNGVMQIFNAQKYSLYRYEVSKAIYINGAMLYEADEFTHITTGAPIGSVFVQNVPKDSMLHSIDMSEIKQIAAIPISNIDEMLSAAYFCIHKEHFVLYSVSYKSSLYFNNAFINNRTIIANYISLPKNTAEIALLQYSDNAWHRTSLLDETSKHGMSDFFETMPHEEYIQ
ncbi:hypothetical protein [Candidatus Lariskella endosymbiont of Hedychridium roseum]|uniref:hypothetical protein n=1 Tax=Candidatus Lariskella endosymbiont of Hedychridium roseum TaxID=3077949 RepID=UPI0030CAE150